MADANTLDVGAPHPYAQTANCLVRRAAFDAIGGFAHDIRSGGDADLCFRLLASGWGLERRPEALAVHRNRRSLAALLAQKARHGSGAAWLERRHPGAFPRRRLLGLTAWSAGQAVSAARRTGGHTEPPVDAAAALVDVLGVWAFELGRMLPNRARRR
jgi:GT2 family glycosyltransferase